MPLLPPTNLTGFAVDPHSIFLSWDPPPQHSLNGILRHYRLSGIEDPTASKFSVLFSSNQRSLSSLHPFYSYTISVAAVTVGEGPYSSNVTIETPQDGKMVCVCVCVCVCVYSNTGKSCGNTLDQSESFSS